jgi:hypothetical protein
MTPGVVSEPCVFPNEEKFVKKSALIFALMTVILMVGLSACGENKNTAQSSPPAATAEAPAAAAAAAPASNPNGWTGTVLETMDSGGYTYVHLDTGSEKIWAAGPASPVAVGQIVTMDKGMAMPEFTSKTLDRTFDVIYFVGSIQPAGAGGQAPQSGGDHPAADHPAADMSRSTSGTQTVLDKAEVGAVAKVAGGYTVEEIHTQGASLGGQTVKVAGQVVKFTPNIMGTNWVHIQDGSGKGDTADLTVTTAAVVATGDLVVVEGVLAVDKDFGAGYKYPVIIEGATVSKK